MNFISVGVNGKSARSGPRAPSLKFSSQLETESWRPCQSLDRKQRRRTVTRRPAAYYSPADPAICPLAGRLRTVALVLTCSEPGSPGAEGIPGLKKFSRG